jgi:hypothetical protein
MDSIIFYVFGQDLQDKQDLLGWITFPTKVTQSKPLSAEKILVILLILSNDFPLK